MAKFEYQQAEEIRDAFAHKSTLAEIRERFDHDVERFSQLETGQSATMDAPLAMELITRAAIASTPTIRQVLDIGCGAGNNVLKLRELYGSDFAADLVDLSRPMLDRATDRLAKVNSGPITAHQADFRTSELSENRYDVILAAAVLHHLREDADWRAAFAKLYRVTAPGGSIWITDLVSHDSEPVQSLMWRRYGEYLTALKDEAYRDKVFAYIEQEDSPRPVTYQLDLLREVGFSKVELLHKNGCFAAFGAVKG